MNIRAESGQSLKCNIDPQGGGSNLLQGLEERVNRALHQSPAAANDATLSPEAVRGYMSQLSGTPFAGLSTVV